MCSHGTILICGHSVMQRCSSRHVAMQHAIVHPCSYVAMQACCQTIMELTLLIRYLIRYAAKPNVDTNRTLQWHCHNSKHIAVVGTTLRSCNIVVGVVLVSVWMHFKTKKELG